MKYIIMWNSGYGDTYDSVEAENFEDAEKMAYESWKEEAESQAIYQAEEYTKERAEELDLD